MAHTNESCPSRGPGLTHVNDKANPGHCVFCEVRLEGFPGPMGIITPSVRRVDGYAPVETRPQHERHSSGFLDDVLDLRNTPISPVLLEDPSRTSAAWQAHQAAVDAVLDILVPAFQLLDNTNQGQDYTHGVNCIQKPGVMKVVGRIPRRFGGLYL